MCSMPDTARLCAAGGTVSCRRARASRSIGLSTLGSLFAGAREATRRNCSSLAAPVPLLASRGVPGKRRAGRPCALLTRPPPTLALQNRASWPGTPSVVQKLPPSLQAPKGFVLAPIPKAPSVVRSAAFQSETLLPIWFVTRTRCPSNAAVVGKLKPLPVSVASTAPVEARTTETAPEYGTQMLVPSKTGNSGLKPMVTVCRMAPEPSSFRSVPAASSVTQTFAPSYRAPVKLRNPVVTVVTVQGSEAPGVTIETDPGTPEFAVHNRDPSNVIS